MMESHSSIGEKGTGRVSSAAVTQWEIQDAVGAVGAIMLAVYVTGEKQAGWNGRKMQPERRERWHKRVHSQSDSNVGPTTPKTTEKPGTRSPPLQQQNRRGTRTTGSRCEKRKKTTMALWTPTTATAGGRAKGHSTLRTPDARNRKITMELWTLLTTTRAEGQKASTRTHRDITRWRIGGT